MFRNSFYSIVFILCCGGAQAQIKFEYPNRAEATKFVQWFTRNYWDSLRLAPCLHETITVLSKSLLYIDSSDGFSRRFSGYLIPYYSKEEIANFLAQINYLNHEPTGTKSPVNNSLPVIEKSAWDTMTPEQIYLQLATIHGWDSAYAFNTLVLENKWTHEFVDSSIRIYTNEEDTFSNWPMSTRVCGTSLAYPIFSIDKSQVMISISNFCGMLCGWGCTYVFCKKGNSWIKLWEVECWVS